MADHEQVRFRRITLADWSRPDPISARFSYFDDEHGTISDMDGDAWAGLFLSVELGAQVPQDIIDLFDVAKSTLVFGWFFYPMYRVGQDELHRVSEAAAIERHRQMFPAAKKPTFARAIKALLDAGVIPAEDEQVWHGARKLRNAASHQSHQAVVTPKIPLNVLRGTARSINVLFSSQPGQGDTGSETVAR